MTVRRKLLLLVCLPVCVSTITAVIISSVKIQNQGIHNLEDKSAAILALNIEEYLIHHQNGSSILELENGFRESRQNYSFRISSPEPENPVHLSRDKDKVFFERFEKEKSNQISYIDSKDDSIWVMRPVFMEKSKGCLECHGVSKSGQKVDENDLRGIFIVTSSMGETKSEVRSAIFQISLIGALITIAAIIIGIWVVMRITSAIQQINIISRKVSEGDLKQKVDIRTNDELGQLGTYINSMVESLNKVLLGVRAAATGLAESTSDIASAAEEISRGAQNQAVLFDQLNSSFQQGSDNARKANNFLEKSVSSARVAETGMTQTIEAMNSIQTSSQKINEAIKIISSISFQTNILALNAAVEASRAGLHGKGFSVIAAEVKKLSDITTNSSGEINHVTTQNLTQVEHGVKIARDAGTNITEILHAVANISDMLKEISHLIKEQLSIIENNLEITNANSQASERLNSSANLLDDQANQLLEIVNYFKLKS